MSSASRSHRRLARELRLEGRWESTERKWATLAVDLAKPVLEIVVSDRLGRVWEPHRLSRMGFERFRTSRRPPTLAALLSCVALLVVANPALAQTVSLGVIGGSSGTTLSGDKPANGSFKAGAGYHLGAQLEITAGPHVRFRLQPMFVSRSMKLEVKDNSDPPSKQISRLEVESFAIPISVSYAIGSRATRVFVETGTELHFLQKFSFFEDGQPDRDLRDTTEPFEASVLLGFGVRSRLRGVPCFAQIRFATGLTNLAAGHPLETGVENMRWKSRSTQLLLGVSFPLVEVDTEAALASPPSSDPRCDPSSRLNPPPGRLGRIDATGLFRR